MFLYSLFNLSLIIEGISKGDTLSLVSMASIYSSSSQLQISTGAQYGCLSNPDVFTILLIRSYTNGPSGQLLTSNKTARKRIKEIHPEICFRAFTDDRPVIHSKKRGKGFSERMEVLLSIYPHTREIVDYTLQKYLRREVAKDDILDALVAAVTASQEGQGLSTIPENPEKDSKGLAMEMVYFIKP